MCNESQAKGKESKMGVPPVCSVIVSSSANLSFFILRATISLNERGKFDIQQFLKPVYPQPLATFYRGKGIATVLVMFACGCSRAAHSWSFAPPRGFPG